MALLLKDGQVISRGEDRVEAAFGICKPRTSAGLQEIKRAIQEGAAG